MKRFSFILLFISLVTLNINSQPSNKLCDAGITFEISNNPSWGYGEPVITWVEPFSPADKEGVKIGDIIMEINGVATYLRNYLTISNWLTEGSNPEIRLTLRNVDTYFKEYTINRNCKDANSINEYNLASAFAFYSIENANNRAFTLPLKVDPNENIDFSDYHTFDFVDEGSDVPAMDHYINAQIEKALTDKGLVRTSDNPDILVQSYYSYQPNLKYNPSTNSKGAKTWRYDSDSEKMVQLPILSGEDPNAEIKGEYILELGMRFFDKKYVDQENLTQIWDCRSREFLTEDYDLQEYTRIHAPLMAMQFPYSTPKSVAKYVVDFKKINYTGLNYDANNMSVITGVDTGSPAYLAGIKEGDAIVKIDGNSLNFTTDEFENRYRRFIVETMQLRDPKTKFIDANGFPDCMLWSKARTQEVSKAFDNNAIYALPFSYLFGFEKYISGSPTLDMEVNSRGSKKKIKLTPEVQNSVVVKAL